MVEFKRVKFHSNLHNSDNEPTVCGVEEVFREGDLFGYFISYPADICMFYYPDEVTVEDIKFPNRSS